MPDEGGVCCWWWHAVCEVVYWGKGGPSDGKGGAPVRCIMPGQCMLVAVECMCSTVCMGAGSVYTS